mgnify:CR=1 FL=1
MMQYEPTGDYFVALVDEYVEAYKARDLPERNRLRRLMRAEFERQKDETDRLSAFIAVLDSIVGEPAFAYTWRGLRRDIDRYAEREVTMGR